MRFLTVLAFFISFCGIRAQSPLDSLRLVWSDTTETDSARFTALNAVYPDYSLNLPDTAFAIASYHLELAKDRDSKDEIVKALNEVGIGLFIQYKPDSSLMLFEEALVIRKAQNDSSGIARLYTNIGSIYRFKNNYQEALRYYIRSLALYGLEEKEKAYKADILNNIGLIYEDVGMPELALDYLEQALELYDEIGVNGGNIWLNMGVVLSKLEKNDLAKQYTSKALELFGNSAWSLTECHFWLAKLYIKEQERDSVYYHLDKAISIGNEVGNRYFVLNSQLKYAELILESNINLATDIAEAVQDSLKGIQDKINLANNYHLLYKCYKAQGKGELALSMHEMYVLYNDSIIEEENKMVVVRAAIEGEFEQKLLLSELENEKQRAEQELKQLKQLYLVVLLGLVLVLSVFAYFRARVIRQHKLQAELLEEIECLKTEGSNMISLQPQAFDLDRKKMEMHIERELNETDWKVLTILLNDPVITNKEIAEKAFMSVDGIGSSLRRMYGYYEIKESKYKKISLLMEAIKLSNA